MARPRDPALRERLIAAASEAFAEQSFAGATMTDIGERAGVTKGGVYFHFRSKENLFYAALDHWRNALRAAVLDAVPGSESGATALRALVRVYLAFHFERPAAGRLLRGLATELRDRFTSALREDSRQEHGWLRAQLRDAFTRGHRDGTLFAGDPVFAAFVVAGSIQGVLEQWSASPQDVGPFCDPDAITGAVVSAWETGATPPQGGAEDGVRDDPSGFRPY